MPNEARSAAVSSPLAVVRPGSILERLCAEEPLWAMHRPRLVALVNAAVTMDARATMDLPERNAIGGTLVGADPFACGGGRSASDSGEGYSLLGSVAVIGIGGPITKNPPTGFAALYGSRVASTQMVRRALATARADARVKGVLLQIDSPGGSISGVETLAQEIADARGAGAKPVWTFFEDLGASAAYWIGVQAAIGRVYAGESAEVGSIGVYAVLADFSAMLAEAGIAVHLVRFGENKGLGAFGLPVDEQTLAKAQERIDAAGQIFVSAVARGLGISTQAAMALATGDVFTAREAVSRGLISGIRRSAEAVAEEMNAALASGGGSNRPHELAGGRASAAKPAASQPAATLAPLSHSHKDVPHMHPEPDPTNGTSATLPPPNPPAPAPTPGPDAGALAAAGTKATIAERKRIADINFRAGALPPGDEYRALAEEAIAQGLSADAFSAKAMEKMAQNAAPTGHKAGAGNDPTGGLTLRIEGDARDKRLQACGEALMVKTQPNILASIQEGGPKGERVARAIGYGNSAEAVRALSGARTSGLMGSRLIDLAAMSVAASLGISQQQVFAQFNGSFEKIAAASFHSSSDFPLLLSNNANKTLLAAFALQETIWDKICAIGNATDFKDAELLRVSEVGDFELVREGNTPRQSTMNERRQTIAVETFAMKVEFSYQMLKNDDLGAFNRKNEAIGNAAAWLPERLFLARLAENSNAGPTMADGVAMFNSAHNNTDTAAALGEPALQAAYIKMRAQTEFGPAKRNITVNPRVLLVPDGLFFTAKDLYEQPYSLANGEKNIQNRVRGMFVPVPTPRLSGTRWYLFAEPTNLAAFQMNFLDGQRTPVINRLTDGSMLKQEFEAVVPGVGCAPVDYEAAYSNAGA